MSALVWAMLLLSLIPWRTGTYYSGGLDPVVLGKAAVGCAALGAIWAMAPSGALRRLRPRTIVIVTVYVSLSLVGAAASGTMFASMVLGGRVLIVLATVTLMMLTFSRRLLLDGMALSMFLFVTVLAATGVSASLARGRLTGGLLPATPNEMAMLCGPPALYLTWRMVHRDARLWEICQLILLVTLTWLTGSRSGLMSLLVGILVVVLMAPRLKLGAFALMVLGLPLVLYVIGFTPVVSSFFARGGEQNLLTLSSRTIAWRAALSQQVDMYQHWFGGGLSVKTVAVTGTFWNTQVLDSSWLSTLVQAGIAGLVLLAVWTATTLWLTARDRTSYRPLWVAMALYAVGTSFLATGLLDAYMLFVIMLVPALSVDLVPTEPDRDGQGSSAADGSRRAPAAPYGGPNWRA